MLPRPVIHRELGHAEAAVVGQHGHEAVQLAVEAQPADDLGRYALRPQFMSCSRIPDTSGHPVEDPRGYATAQRVAPPSSAGHEVEALVELGEQLGISAGSSWRSPSIVTTTSPRTCAKPAASAAALPKFRRSRTMRTFAAPNGSGSARRRCRRVEPSSTKIVSHGRLSGSSAAPARHEAARRCAPRRVPVRRPRSRRLVSSGPWPSCCTIEEALVALASTRAAAGRRARAAAGGPLDAVLAAAAVPPVDLPPFASSAMDGMRYGLPTRPDGAGRLPSSPPDGRRRCR